MQRRSNTQVSSLIVFLSILTILIQFAAYYFLVNTLVIWGISSIISYLCCHILLEQSSTYESCFIYSILTVFISLTIAILTYGMNASFIMYSDILIGIVVINWLVPTVHCFFRQMFDYGTRVEHFTSFYRNNNIVFVLFYIIILAYGSFSKDAFPWIYKIGSETTNFTPFWTLSALIEDYLYGIIPLKDIITYVAIRVVVFIPYGFYCSLILRNQRKLVKFILLLLLPAVIEAIQYFIFTNRCDIDDVLYAFVGGLLGMLSYFLMNLIFRAVSGKDFLSKDKGYRFTNSSLRF